MTRYAYKTFIAQDLNEMFDGEAAAMPDSYLADDTKTRAIKDALRQGFRWVRTDGAYAILEKILQD